MVACGAYHAILRPLSQIFQQSYNKQWPPHTWTKVNPQIFCLNTSHHCNYSVKNTSVVPFAGIKKSSLRENISNFIRLWPIVSLFSFPTLVILESSVQEAHFRGDPQNLPKGKSKEESETFDWEKRELKAHTQASSSNPCTKQELLKTEQPTLSCHPKAIDSQ